MMLMYCGHTPREIDRMPASDVMTFLETLPALVATTNGLRYDG